MIKLLYFIAKFEVREFYLLARIGDWLEALYLPIKRFSDVHSGL